MKNIILDKQMLKNSQAKGLLKVMQKAEYELKQIEKHNFINNMRLLGFCVAQKENGLIGIKRGRI